MMSYTAELAAQGGSAMLDAGDLATGMVTMCAAGGMAPAIIIERV